MRSTAGLTVNVRIVVLTHGTPKINNGSLDVKQTRCYAPRMKPAEGDAKWIAYAALVAVSFFWGTTYLGIRMSLESFPPLYLIAIRYSLSGGLLLIVAKLAKAYLVVARGARGDLALH